MKKWQSVSTAEDETSLKNVELESTEWRSSQSPERQKPYLQGTGDMRLLGKDLCPPLYSRNTLQRSCSLRRSGNWTRGVQFKDIVFYIKKSGRELIQLYLQLNVFHCGPRKVPPSSPTSTADYWIDNSFLFRKQQAISFPPAGFL